MMGRFPAEYFSRARSPVPCHARGGATNCYESASRACPNANPPANLCHVHDPVNGSAIIAKVVYVGADFSGWPGNYVVPALVAEDPAKEFSTALPVELWESPVWSCTEANGPVMSLYIASRPSVRPPWRCFSMPGAFVGCDLVG